MKKHLMIFTIFSINRRDNLYFLNNINNSTTKYNTSFEWQIILGHFNIKDVINLQNKVLGMNITNQL